jgi:hypothetical protein
MPDPWSDAGPSRGHQERRHGQTLTQRARSHFSVGRRARLRPIAPGAVHAEWAGRHDADAWQRPLESALSVR